MDIRIVNRLAIQFTVGKQVGTLWTIMIAPAL